MAAIDTARTITDLLEPLARSHGFELVAVEQTGGRKSPVIRVLLDGQDGIDLDALCSANRWVSEAIDSADGILGSYTLEVSSPGVDRPLRTREHFQRFAGETATVKTDPHGGSRSTWTGTLLGIEGDDVVLEVEGESVRIPFDSVLKARLKGVISFNKEGGVCS